MVARDLECEHLQVHCKVDTLIGSVSALLSNWICTNSTDFSC